MIQQLSMRVADIVPAVRSKLSDVDIFNKNVVTAGWGRIADNSKTQFLHKGYLRVLTPQLCERNVLKLFGSEDEMEDSMPENHYCTSAEPPLILGCVSNLSIENIIEAFKMFCGF